MVGSAESAGGEIAVSARALGRRLLHDQYSLSVLSGGVRGAECGVAAAHHHDIVKSHLSFLHMVCRLAGLGH
jgi:hypothetical protein